MTIVITQAWNAEATLPETIESVLSQQGANIEYHIIDSASTDSTWNLILDAAKRDRRVVPVRRRENQLMHFLDYIEALLEDPEIPANTNITIVDADDLLLPNAVQKLEEALVREDADIAIGGTAFSAQEGQDQTLWIRTGGYDRDRFKELFPYLTRIMRPTWGKLYPMALLRKCNLQVAKRLRCSGDTLVECEIFKHVRRMASVSDPVIRYINRPSSITRKFDRQRLEAPVLVYEAFRSFLDSIGPIGDEEQENLFEIYLNDASAEIWRIYNQRFTPKEAANYAKKIWEHPLYKEAMSCASDKSFWAGQMREANAFVIKKYDLEKT